MPDYASSVLALIDARVDHARPIVTKMGTVQSRDTTGARAMVAFDGSSGVAQPVKCFETVIVDSGDRVGMVKFESDWIIVGNYTLRTLGTSAMNFTWTGTSTTTSATYVDLPSSPALAFLKVRDDTQIRIRLAMSMYSATAGFTVFKIAARVTLAGLTVDYDQDILHFDISQTSPHVPLFGIATTTGDIPAGNYTLTGRWLRSTGTGTGTVDTQDMIMIEAQEVVI